MYEPRYTILFELLGKMMQGVQAHIFLSRKAKQMSRPHGAFHTTEEKKFVKASSFQVARKSFVDILDNLSFVKVVSVQTNQKGIYFGEAIEATFRNSKERPKLVFFDKLGRSRTLLRVGPIHVAQAPLGFDHASAIPTVGDILVGSLVPNTRKSHLDHVLRGWSSDAKPLWELLRLLKFGTKASEFECRSILLQPVSSMFQAPDYMQSARDDIYMTARVILWSSLRPLQVKASLELPDVKLKVPATSVELETAKQLRISSTASEFVDILVAKCNDATILEQFFEGLEVPESTKTDIQAPAPIPLTHYAPATYEPYTPHSPIQISQTYVAQSPVYATTSPVYAPTSPDYAPTSPVYAPQSPTFRPSSPAYAVPQPTADDLKIQIPGFGPSFASPTTPIGPPSPIYETV